MRNSGGGILAQPQRCPGERFRNSPPSARRLDSIHFGESWFSLVQPRASARAARLIVELLRGPGAEEIKSKAPPERETARYWSQCWILKRQSPSRAGTSTGQTHKCRS